VPEILLDVNGLKIEATAYPPGEPPRTVTLVEGVSFTVEKRARCWA
jgi:peptide/nickel transport system ATP-binding protein